MGLGKAKSGKLKAKTGEGQKVGASEDVVFGKAFRSLGYRLFVGREEGKKGSGDESRRLFPGVRGDRDGDPDQDRQEDDESPEGAVLFAVLPALRGVVDL